MTDLIDQLVEWIAQSVRGQGARGAVVGLSGGIDSAVTVALCSRALGDDVLGVIMPCESDQRDEEDAFLLAAHLDLKTVCVRLNDPFEAIVRVLPAADQKVRANLKPRLRMAALYFLANMHSYLVVGTGNKTELMLGYFTKHGDGGVDLLPIGGLYKTQVRQLARELGIPDRIIEKAPSAGLWAGQTDEEELGIVYEDLDRTLEAIEHYRLKDAASGALRRVARMIGSSAHKRTSAPIFDVEREPEPMTASIVSETD
jgi:NAD+ synthase